MPAMLHLYRLTSPLVAAALAILPLQSASAAPAPAPTPTSEAPAEPPAEAPEGADSAAPPEGAEGAEGVEEPPAEPEPAEEAAPEPEPPAALPEPEGPKKPDEPTVAGKPATGKGLLIAGGTILGVGVGVTIASVLLTRCPDLSNTVGCKYNEQRDFLIPVSASVLTTGVLVLAVGIGFKIRHNRWKKWSPEGDGKRGKKVKETALVPTFVAGGAGLGYVGRF